MNEFEKLLCVKIRPVVWWIQTQAKKAMSRDLGLMTSAPVNQLGMASLAAGVASLVAGVAHPLSIWDLLIIGNGHSMTPSSFVKCSISCWWETTILHFCSFKLWLWKQLSSFKLFKIQNFDISMIWVEKNMNDRIFVKL